MDTQEIESSKLVYRHRQDWTFYVSFILNKTEEKLGGRYKEGHEQEKPK